MAKWDMVRLGDVCEVVSGSTPSTYNPELWKGSIKWVTPAEINDDSYFIYDTVRHISGQAGLKPMPMGTVLLSSRAPIGKVAIAGKEMCCNQGFKNLICSEKIHNRYLYRYLKEQTGHLNSLGRGATFKEISKSIVEQIEIPLPPLSVQKQIADILDRVSTLIEKRKAQIAKLDLLVKSRFVEMFGDPVTNPMGWKVQPFSVFARIDATMTTEYEKYAEYPHIGIDSIESGTGELKGYRTVKQDGVKSGKYIFTSNHIIYSKIRPNLNKVALPAFDGLCSADAYPILNNSENCDRVFLAYVLRSKFFLAYVQPFSYRTNFPKVNREQITGFSMPLPPLNLQTSFADFVRATDKSKFAMRKSLNELETMYKALAQSYFG